MQAFSTWGKWGFKLECDLEACVRLGKCVCCVNARHVRVREDEIKKHSSNWASWKERDGNLREREDRRENRARMTNRKEIGDRER